MINILMEKYYFIDFNKILESHCCFDDNMKEIRSYLIIIRNINNEKLIKKISIINVLEFSKEFIKNHRSLSRKNEKAAIIAFKKLSDELWKKKYE